MATFLPAFAVVIFGWAPGGMELVLILFIVLLLFGAKRLPELAKGLGQSIKEFKKASSEDSPAKPAADADAAKPAETRKSGNGGPTPGAN
jgi:sec-independent protein translocase protein TatA